jgi:2-(1,2-epoxy-1,2-dihydrophenyl)acetyl-CoA isomerase
MPDGRIHLEMEDGIATVIIDRPAKRNALTAPMRRTLLEALRRANESPVAQVLVVTGVGDSFCSGGDIEVLKNLKANEDEAGFEQLLDDGKEIVSLLRSSMKPSLAKVNGPAFGAGFFMALACDLRLCGHSASFGAPFVRLGLGPDWGGTYLLPRLVGNAKALEMLYTGTGIDAAEAQRIGLANRVYPDAELNDKVTALARELAARPPQVLARYKQAIHATWDMSFDTTAEMERRLQLQNFRSPDFAEGIAAFLEKRPPNFT